MKQQLTVVARAAAGPAAGPAEILYDRHGVLVVRVGDAVAKAHRPQSAELAAKVATALARPDVLLAPLGPVREVAGRQVSVWPAGLPVDPDDPEGAPWEEGGRLLAALHETVPEPGSLPPQGAPAKVREIVLDRLPRHHPAARPVLRAFAALPDPLEAGPDVTGLAPRLVHGDWHLGQLVRVAAGWRLIDLDDLGVGDPAWDLARPAALFAAGILAPDVWARFLGAYRDAGGCAIPPGADPWERLDVPARALAIQTAARCVSHAVEEERDLDAYETALIDTCDRIGGVSQA